MATEIQAQFATLPGRKALSGYNFTHFRAKHGLSDACATVERRGVQPGIEAPDFTLPDTNGQLLRLSDLRGKPVLLHFGSST